MFPLAYMGDTGRIYSLCQLDQSEEDHSTSSWGRIGIAVVLKIIRVEPQLQPIFHIHFSYL